LDRLRQATKEQGIDYPDAVDNDYAIWSAFDNHYRPALYFVDADGIIRDHHSPAGGLAQCDVRRRERNEVRSDKAPAMSMACGTHPAAAPVGWRRIDVASRIACAVMRTRGQRSTVNRRPVSALGWASAAGGYRGSVSAR
jgi:hypothetical protein